MTDRDKVIEGLEELKQRLLLQKDILGYGYHVGDINDALALLREQEPVEPYVEHDSDDDSWYYGCSACHEAIDYKDKFCRHCGRAVKWD